MTGARHDSVLALIVGQQRRPDRNVPSVATEGDALLADLDELEPDWRDTLRLHHVDGRVVGAVVAEWSDGATRTWIHGPWVDADGERWTTIGRILVRAAAAQVPEGVEVAVLSSDERHVDMAALAAAMGWERSRAHHVLVIDGATVGRWRTPSHDRVRAVVPTDLDAVSVLHDDEFPATYESAVQLLERAGRDDRCVLVGTDGAGTVQGYAAGRMQADGEGFIDFVAVAAAARGTGLGRELVEALTRRLVRRSSISRVALVVRADRLAARRLYGRLGFTSEQVLVAYEGHPSST